MSRDLMFTDDVHELVYSAYAALETPSGPGTRYYEAEQLARLPEGARRWALGVGNPTLHAGVESGETVVDLGCGAGIDVLLAAELTGATGHSIGIDFLASMVGRGRAFAAEAGLDHVRFAQGTIEDVPIPDRTADVVISNGAANLSARKSRVFAEAHRILREGGRICFSDLTLSDDELPPEILTHPSAWAG